MLRKIIRKSGKALDLIKRQAIVSELLTAQNQKRYQHNLDRYDDLGRRLQDYNRAHTTIMRVFGKTKLVGKKFVHFGSGNTNYCDYLNRTYGVRAFAVDPNREYLEQARKKGSKALRVARFAEQVNIKPNSVDIILSDHFLFSNYGIIAGEKETTIFRNSIKQLKVGGILILERCAGYYVEEKLKNLLSIYNHKIRIIEKGPFIQPILTPTKIRGEMFVIQKVAE